MKSNEILNLMWLGKVSLWDGKGIEFAKWENLSESVAHSIVLDILHNTATMSFKKGEDGLWYPDIIYL